MYCTIVDVRGAFDTNSSVLWLMRLKFASEVMMGQKGV